MKKKEDEAIEWIKELRDSEEIREFYYAENFIKACDRAIQALEKRVSKTSCDVDKIVEQHIFYLNEEENRYLAELRDALLPELMSGKIDVEKLKGDDI